MLFSMHAMQRVIQNMLYVIDKYKTTGIEMAGEYHSNAKGKNG